MKQRLGGVIVIGLVVGQIAAGGQARAADGAPVTMAMQQPAQAPSPTPTPPPQQPRPLTPEQQWGTPPPGYGSAPPAPGTAPPPPPAYGQPSNQMTFVAYQAQRRNVGLAVLIEFVVPGLGSLYGDHAMGAVITWTLMLAGIGMMIWGLSDSFGDHDHDRLGMTGDRPRGTDTLKLSVGLIMFLGGRVYGLADSYLSTDAYNLRLRQRLGMPAGVAFGVGRIGSGQVVTYGPRLSFTF